MNNGFLNNSNTHFNSTGSFGQYGAAQPEAVNAPTTENALLQPGMNVDISDIDVVSAVLPEGIYNFKITKAELVDYMHKPGGKLPDCTEMRVGVQLLPPTGEVAFATIHFYLINDKMQLRKLRDFYVSIGMLDKEAKTMQITSDVKGKFGRAKVKPHDYTGKDGKTNTNNQVEFFMELDPDDPIPDGAPMGSDGLPF